MITEELLSGLGIQAQHRGDEFILDCPYCGKPGHMYLNESGAYKCHKCGEGGGWVKLRAEFNGGSVAQVAPRQNKYPPESYVDGCHKRIKSQSGVEAWEYITSRGITREQIEQHKIGLDNKDGLSWITIPIVEDGQYVNIKYRSLPPAKKQFKRWEGGRTALFNGDILKGMKPEEAIYVTEGEIDCLSLCKLGLPSVGITGGAGTIDPSWIDRLAKFQRLNLCFDNDEPGQKGAKEFARRFGIERCFNVKLPVNDCNDWIRAGNSRGAFDSLVDQSRAFDVDNVATIESAFREVMREWEKNKDGTHILPPWPSVAKLTGSFDPGDLIVVAAKAKTGKTTFMLNQAHKWAAQGHPVLFYCLEMRPSRILRKLIQIELQRREDELVPAKLVDGFNRLEGQPLYIGYNYRKCTADVIFDTTRQAWRRYGIHVVVFDNLQYLVRDIANSAQETAYVSRSFKLLAEELEIPIILISQPKRTDRETIIGIDDLKGSGSIGDDADLIIILYREKTKAKGQDLESFKSETLVRVDASRYHAGGETILIYTGEKATFTEPIRKPE